MTILWLYIEFEVFVRHLFENNHQAVEYLTIHDSDLDKYWGFIFRDLKIYGRGVEAGIIIVKQWVY